MNTTIYRLRIKKTQDKNNQRYVLIKDIGLFNSKELAIAYAFNYVIALKHAISNKNDGKIPNKYHFTDLSNIDLFSNSVKSFIKEDNNDSDVLWYLYIKEETLYDNDHLMLDDQHLDSLI